MVVRGNLLKNIILFGIVIVLFGQLMNKIIAYHVGITGLYFSTVLILTSVAVLLEIQKPSVKFLKADLFFTIFFAFVLIKMYVYESANTLNIFLSFAVLPYILGRLLVRRFNLQLTTILYPIILVCVFFLGVEFINEPTLFQKDRIRLFELGSSMGVNEEGGATQHFAGTVFGGGACLAFFYIVANFQQRRRLISKVQAPSIFMFVISFAGLILVGSKASFVALLVVCLVSIFRMDNFLKSSLVLCFVSLVMLAVLSLGSAERIAVFSSLLSIDSANLDLGNICITGKTGGAFLVRVQMLYDSFVIWMNAPLFGAGPGSFGVLDCDIANQVGHPHNLVAHLLSELGLIGLILFSLAAFFATRSVQSPGESFQYNQFKVLFYFSLVQAMFIGTGYLADFNLYFLLGVLCCKHKQAE